MMCGIDEAGRGSVMGPLVVGSVCIESDLPLRTIGVKDSKKLAPAVRERMFDLIADACASTCTVVISAADIDEKRKRMSLNIIELEMFLDAVSGTKPDIIYADCPDVDENRFSGIMTARLDGARVIAEHKADDTYPVVSAASIVAKVTRDRMMDSISKEFGIDVGSGYPSDRQTMDFIEKWIRDNGSPPKHTRCSWEPVRHLMSMSKSTRLSDW
jgi:ribonuclease HII